MAKRKTGRKKTSRKKKTEKPDLSEEQQFGQTLNKLTMAVVKKLLTRAASGEKELKTGDINKLHDLAEKLARFHDDWQKTRIKKTDLQGILGRSRQKIFNRVEAGDFPQVPPDGITVSEILRFIPELWDMLSEARKRINILEAKLEKKEREPTEKEREEIRARKIKNDLAEGKLVPVEDVREYYGHALAIFREEFEAGDDKLKIRLGLTKAQSAKLDDRRQEVLEQMVRSLEKKG